MQCFDSALCSSKHCLMYWSNDIVGDKPASTAVSTANVKRSMLMSVI